MADGSITIDTKIDQKGAEQGVGTLQKNLNGTAKKMKKVGGQMSKYVTAPMAALGTASIVAADTVDKAYNNIIVGTGATGDKLDSLKSSFDNVFKNVPNSADEVSNAISNLNTLTGATGPVLEDLTKNVLDASRTLGEDGVANSEAFGQAMGQWQIPADQGVTKLDELYQMTKDYGVGLDQITGHLNTYGSVLQNAGFNMTESADLMARLEAKGISVSRVMPGLNKAFRNWADEGKNSREEFEKVANKMRDAETETEALKIATEAFGAEGAQRMTTAIRNGAIPALDELGEGFDDTKGGIQETSDQTKTIGERFQELKNRITSDMAPLGQIFLDLAERWLPPIIDGVTKLASWFNNLSPTTQKLVVVLGAVAAAIGPLLLVLGSLMSALPAIIPMIKGVGAAFRFMTGPVGLIINLVALLAIFVVTHWEQIKAVTITVFTAIWGFLQSTWNVIVEVVKIAVQGIWGTIQAIWTMIKTITVTIFTGIWTFLQATWNVIWTVIKTVAQGIWGTIKAVWNMIKTTTQAVWNAIKTVISTVWNIIKSIVQGAINVVKTVITTVWNTIKAVTTTVWNTIKKIISTVWNTIKTIVSRAINGVKSTISSVWNIIKSITSSVWNGIKDTVGGFIDTIWGTVKRVFGKIKDFIGDAWDGVKSGTDDVWDGITGSVKGAINGVIGAINGMIDALNGLSIKLPKIPDWVPGLGGKGGGSISFPNIPNIPSLDVGTNFVAKDGLAMIHKGEAVVPKEYNPALGNGKGNENKQPVIINLRLGASNFSSFVDDITRNQDRKRSTLKRFRG
ncbi:phage tail tape measure protein [Virgibacillus salexigens]|uniref:Phage tail tape measure protein, TP901 family, core region n=1 Tax=Virgibacillus massiliensis TaxID=1462526 RepID=A0A024QH21_9BACI|nr:phage tail tape measure protein [Virgibacillus massiliensis]CDQ41512.1 phage tail tape measure protein, TP901 family, core region [Virgibacillus massiliensis]